MSDTPIVTVDIGGTHARFALAHVAKGKRPELGEARKYRTAEHEGLTAAWVAFARDMGGTLPKAAAIAVAGPVDEEVVKFTNNPWMLRPGTLAAELGVDRLTLINDFGAVAHAVAWLNGEELVHLGGPQGDPGHGITTIAGLGTGLGVAQLLRRQGDYVALSTEGAHGDFAPLDALEDQILVRLRARYMRVSDERIVSGPGLGRLYEALAAIGGHAITPRDDAALWEAAIAGSDPVAVSALDRLVLCFGSVLGDLALRQGANRVVVTGSLANRVRERLQGPLFHQRFCAKGRFAQRMESFPIQLAIHDEPGLLGATAAFAQEQG